MSIKEWLKSANELAKQGYSKQQLINELGSPPGRITSNGNGGWKQRSGNKRGQGVRRRQFDTTSTDSAYSENKRLNNNLSKVNGEANMYGLETMQMEHIADQQDSKAMHSGAPGDPSNKLPVTTSDARFKDSAKQRLGKQGFAVVTNGAQESLKAIPHKYFDPIADPNTLPGIDIKTPADLDIVDEELKRSEKLKQGLNAMRGFPGQSLAPTSGSEIVDRANGNMQLNGNAATLGVPLDLF